MSKYSRNTGYYDHSNNRWVDGKYYSSDTAGLTFKDWMLFLGLVAAVLLLLTGVLEIGCWLMYNKSFIFPPKY